MAICHIPISIIKRSKGKSAVSAAAYCSGTRITNEWDGVTHDYRRKRGVVHTEIRLPKHAPLEFMDRSTLWNSVERIEKAKDSQLAREVEMALPRELNRAQQLDLVRGYVQELFVDVGMCADIALHDKGDGNPHAHILLTLRPLKADGAWDVKCRKAYDLDANGQRIPDGRGGWKNHRENTVDWNDRGKAEQWRAAWAAHVNQALEAAGRPERIDHRSYERQGIDQIPTVHMGVAAIRMEQRGMVTDKGNLNRQIAADNKLLKEVKARITRLYNWSKQEAEKPDAKESVMGRLMRARLETDTTASTWSKVRSLKESAAIFNLLMENGISSMVELYEKIAVMNSDYYTIRGRITAAERQIAELDEHLKMWSQVQQYRPVAEKLKHLKPATAEDFRQKHHAELALYEAAEQHLKKVKDSGEALAPKQWKAKVAELTAQKDADYVKMRALREQIRAIENLKKTAEKLEREEQRAGKEMER